MGSMKKDWPTQDFDMNLAASVIQRHIELNNGEPLVLVEELFEHVHDTKEKIPAWIMDLTDSFILHYGLHKGREITSRVLTKCFLAGQTIH